MREKFVGSWFCGPEVQGKILDTGLPKGAQLTPNAALMNWEMPLTILASALQGQLVFAFFFFFFLFKSKMRTISRVLMVLL